MKDAVTSEEASFIQRRMLIEHMVDVCHLSGVPIRFNVSKCELRVAPGLVRGARELTGRCSLEDRDLSGQLIRLELALWEHMTEQNRRVDEYF